ncbi:hypothetical protein [Paludisphaera borealis]|uniref:Uncharacterized protein n=1 Tax=Paludisphaera borealis TaxID=1387353 RepID=A0A1U7CWM5_9BACT|nr:hypothetical protein [Paludisphaera borealis]APW63335.1 hypothetical protein BSF38_04899 [Paludisphaera borealis]
MDRATPLNADLVNVASPRLAAWSRALGSPRGAFGPARLGLLACVAALVSSGCSGRTSYITGGPSTGQLKTSLSHLEYENDQLKTQVARLKEENRTMEDRLVQEQMHTGTLTAKLDDARNAMRDRGLDVDEVPAHPRTLPAGRKTSKPRKPPTAQISTVDDDDDPPPLKIDDDPRPRSSSSRAKPRPKRPADDSVSLNIDDENVNWLPVANGADAKAPAKR